MRRICPLAAAFVFAVLGAAPTLAETRCEPVAAGPEVYSESRDVLPQLQTGPPEFRCRSDDGLMLTPERTADGAPILRDMQGVRVMGRADSFGVTTFPDVETTLPSATTSRIPTPATTFVLPGGAAAHVLPSGRIEQSAVDQLGNSVIRDGQGGIRRCWTDPVGVTSCD